MEEKLKAIIATLKSLRVDGTFNNADAWVGCVMELERIKDGVKALEAKVKELERE